MITGLKDSLLSKWKDGRKVNRGKLKIAVNDNLLHKWTGSNKISHDNLRVTEAVEITGSTGGATITMELEAGAEEDKYISL